VVALARVARQRPLDEGAPLHLRWQLHRCSLQDGSADIMVLHEHATGRARMLRPRKAHHEGHVVHLGGRWIPALAHIVPIADGMAVVCGEYQQRVVQPPQDTKALHKVAEPAVAHGDFAIVVGAGTAQERFVELQGVLISRLDLLLPLLFQVHASIVGGHQPRLMGVERLHGQKEALGILILLQPEGRRLEHLRREIVLLFGAIVDVHDALLDKLYGLLVLQLAG